MREVWTDLMSFSHHLVDMVGKLLKEFDTEVRMRCLIHSVA